MLSGSLSFDDGQVKDFCKNPQSKRKVKESFIPIVKIIDNYLLLSFKAFFK
jgi:hypothetical protein